MDNKKILELAQELLKATKENADFLQELEKASTITGAYSTKPNKQKTPITKDDKPHPPNSPEDKAHDVAEDGENLKEALKEIRGNGSEVLSHLRTLKDKSKHRSPENKKAGETKKSENGFQDLVKWMSTFGAVPDKELDEAAEAKAKEDKKAKPSDEKPKEEKKDLDKGYKKTEATALMLSEDWKPRYMKKCGEMKKEEHLDKDKLIAGPNHPRHKSGTVLSDTGAAKRTKETPGKPTAIITGGKTAAKLYPDEKGQKRLESQHPSQKTKQDKIIQKDKKTKQLKKEESNAPSSSYQNIDGYIKKYGKYNRSGFPGEYGIGDSYENDDSVKNYDKRTHEQDIFDEVVQSTPDWTRDHHFDAAEKNYQLADQAKNQGNMQLASRHNLIGDTHRLIHSNMDSSGNIIGGDLHGRVNEEEARGDGSYDPPVGSNLNPTGFPRQKPLSRRGRK
jgi:hypothetical protein